MSESRRPAGIVAVNLPRTVDAIRAALPPEKATEFAAQWEGTEAVRLPQLTEFWWREAVLALSGTDEIPFSGGPGANPSVRAEDVFPDYADLLTLRRAAM